MEQGYTPRELHFDSEGRNKLTSGIAKISKAVKSTLGPRGQTVLIESRTHTHGITVTKDGVTVAKAIDLLDPVENLAVKMMKEAADRTATSAGDGTTTAIVLTEALVEAGEKYIDKSVNPTVVIREINKHTSHVIKNLEKQSKKLSKKRLLDVATISSNNDKEIGKIIYDTNNKVGQDGLVTVENSQGHTTYSEVTKGIRVERGYTSNLFVNNQKKDECVLENVKILVVDQEINNILSIEKILKPIISNGDKLLIIGNCHNNVVNTLAANVVRNGLKICNIMPPQFGYKQHELMSDIALAVGAKYFSDKTGDDLSLISMEDLGHAAKVIVGRDNTIIIRNQDEVAEIPQRVEELWGQHKNTKIKSEKDFILQRIASLSGGIGVIYVGGNSDVEQKEKFDRVDDAVCAVRSALEEGIVAGGGVPLLKISKELQTNVNNAEEKVALQILKDALSVPCKQILINAGEDEDSIIKFILDDKRGYDVKNQKFGDMYKMGVIDPLKVTKNALINAVSVATTILSTNAIITLARSYDNKQ
jgi:chaperonin GroEL